MHFPPADTTSSLAATCAHIATQIAQHGWYVCPNFLDAALVDSLRQHSLQAWQAGQFHQAGVGRGDDFEVRPAIRNDQVLWLSPEQASDDLAQYFHALETLRLSINRVLYLGLFDYEAHFAVYAPGSFYTKHLDQFRGSGLRTVTTTFYLNADWLPAHAGQLRLYTEATDPDRFIDVLPTAGTLVVFLSAEYPHEVLPATRERLSISGWFRRREL